MPDTVGNTFSAARAVTLAPAFKTFSDSVEYSGTAPDNDYYRFTLARRSSFTATLTGLTANADIELYNSSGVVNSSSVNTGTLTEAINTLLDPGTYYIRVFPGPATDPANPATTTPSTSYNLNLVADEGTRTDILWRRYASGGANAVWEMNGTTLTAGVGITPSTTDLNWQQRGVGDFNGDANTDIVWRNQATGANAIWLMNGLLLTATANLPVVTNQNWQIQGAVDFNGDRQTDVVWHNSVTGRTSVWLMNGATVASVVDLSPDLPSADWEAQAFGDFNADGQTDIVWRNQRTGDNRIWLMNGSSLGTPLLLDSVNNPNFRFQGAGDFNNDGQLDLLTRNYSTGENTVWLLNGPVRRSIVTINPVADLNWRAIAGFTRPVPPTQRDIAGNSTGAALNIGALNGNAVYRDVVGGADTNDYYQFFLNSRTEFSLNLNGNGGSLDADLDVRVFSADGRYSRDGNASGPESLTDTLEPGTYFIRIFPKTSGSSAYDLTLNANNLPVLASKNPLTLGEGAVSTISNNLLLVTDDNNTASQLTYTLLAPPDASKGLLSLGNAAISTNSTFTQADINSGLLTYRQNGSEALSDSFVFGVSDGVGGQIAATTFSINITPVNDPPLLVSNSSLTLDEGSATTLSTAVLQATDAEQTAAQLIYSLNALPSAGTLSLGNASLTTGGTFTQADVDSGKLLYRHNGSETTRDSFVFTVTDGVGGTAIPSASTFSINVTPVNDPPVLVTNVGLTVSEDESRQLSRTLLSATDAEFQSTADRDRIIYTIVSGPQNGSINRGATTGVTSFTQADIDNGRVFYDHNGSKTNSDSFTFTLSDGVNTTEPYTFSVAVSSVNFVPILATNLGLTVAEGATQAITPTELQVSDADNAPPELVYTLVAAPSGGTLNRLGTPLSVGQTFTQADIDAQTRISYQNSGAETPTRDSFVFSVSDRAGAGFGNRTFSIAVTPVDDPPTLQTNQTLGTSEGAVQIISSTLLSASDVDTAPQNLVYSVVSAPTSGTLIRSGVSNIDSFTQADINSGALRYQQNGSESLTDSFVFRLSDGTTALDSQTFNIAIASVNDLPVVISNAGITVNEGESSAINSTVLSATDVDGPAALTYSIVNAPTTGQLRVGSATLSTGSTFSQADLAAGNLLYVHNGAESPRTDVFTFVPLDGSGDSTPISRFSINITPVNDPPVFVSFPTTTLAPQEDTLYRFSDLSSLIRLTDAENDSLRVEISAGNGTLATGTTRSDRLTLNGRASAVNSSLNNLTYLSNLNFNGPDTINISVSDGTNTVNQTISVNVTAVNDPPVLTLPQTLRSITVPEDTARTLTGIVVTDVDSGENPVLLTLTAPNGILTLGSDSGLEFLSGTANGGSTVSVAGTIADIATALQSLSYQGSPNFNGTDTLTISLDDQGNVGGTVPPATSIISIRVTAVNDPPSFSLPTTEITVDEDSSTPSFPAFATNISKGAPNEETTQTVAFTLVADNPSLFKKTTSGQPDLRIDPTTGNLTFNLAPNAFGTTTVTATLKDNGGGTDTSPPQTFTINVNPVVDPPDLTVTGPAIRSVNEDTQLSLGGVSVSAPDAGTSTIEVSLSALQGILTLQNTTGLTVNSNGTSTVTVQGSQTAINAALTSLNYQGNLNYNGPDTITLTLNDLGASGGGSLIDTESLSINVIPVNDAPQLTLPTGPLTASEDTALPFTDLRAIQLTDVDSGENPIRLTLSVTNGTLNLSSTGLTLVSGDVGTRTVTYDGTVAALRTALSTLVYTPKLNYNGSDQLTVTVNDNGFTGATSGTNLTQSVSISVTPVNDAPVLVTNNTLLVSEQQSNQPLRTNIITSSVLRTTDVESTPAQIVYTIATAPSTTIGSLLLSSATLSTGSTFTQDDINNRRLGYVQSGSESTSDSFVFRVSDGEVVLPDTTFNITINPVNDIPVLLTTNPTLSLSEGANSVISSTLLQATDPDNTPIELRYTLTSQPSNGVLRLSGSTLGANQSFTQSDINSGRLSYQHNGSETTRDSFGFRVADPAGGSASATFNIAINPVNDRPQTVSTGPLTVAEGATRTITRTILLTSDPDTPAANLVYTLPTTPVFGTLRLGNTSLGSGATFTQQDIDNGLVTYEQNGSETTSDVFVFRVSDGTTTLSDRVFNINITPVDDLPVLVTNAGISVASDSPSVTQISNAELLVTDVDNTNQEIIYTLRSPLPTSGSLQLNGATLAVGSTFTQADIDSGNLSFVYSGSGGVDTSFQFGVSDGAGGTLSDDFFYISFTSP